MNNLLTRANFREAVFSRDSNQCVVCSAPAADAHHIMERRLFRDGSGGYFIDNGVSLCSDCHIKAETTEFSCDYLRECAGIQTKVLPEDFYDDVEYTKWGDPVLPDGRRMQGPLFFDESVQKILRHGDQLGNYLSYVKYPRTRHLPWSSGITTDDKVLRDCNQWEGRNVVVTEKMDGENTTFYNDYVHARSIDGRNHWSRDWVKNFHSKIAHDIPYGFRICGENVYAVHSIEYSDLKTFFYGFSVWNESNVCLSWDDTLKWFDMIGITPVKVLWEGVWDEDAVKNIKVDTARQEGYVVRSSDAFSYSDFASNVGKYVRASHVKTDSHWMYSRTGTNQLNK